MRRALELFERARASPRSATVTRVARAIASPRGHGGSAEAGLRAHSVWGDPFEACAQPEYWTPMPLACELGGAWVYGVADLVRFVRGRPVEVVELKHYAGSDEYSRAQVSIYAWMLHELFGVAPRAYLALGWDGRRFRELVEVPYEVDGVRESVRRALARLGLLEA